jgi:hypothetical protein
MKRKSNGRIKENRIHNIEKNAGTEGRLNAFL